MQQISEEAPEITANDDFLRTAMPGNDVCLQYYSVFFNVNELFRQYIHDLTLNIIVGINMIHRELRTM